MNLVGFKTNDRQALLPFPQLMAYYGKITKHKLWVMWYIVKICVTLLRRGVCHDNTKYLPVEIEAYVRWTEAFRGISYGTPEYWKAVKRFGPVPHYQLNSHHPEHYPNGINDMSPLDLIEMLADWRAANRRKNGCGMKRSIELNAVGHRIEDGLKRGIERDVREIGL